MEEQVAPSLSHYKAQGYNFESSVIQRMELMVLTTLEWKMSCITPFAYLHHFFSKVQDECECDEFLVSKSIELILDFSKGINASIAWFILGFFVYQKLKLFVFTEINSMDYRPSVVAIASVLLACDDQLTRNTMELKIGVVSSLYSLEKVRPD